MSKFSTKGTEVSEGKKYITPGINVVMITEIVGEAPEGKAPFLDFKFKEKSDATGNVRLYMSDAASPKSLEKLKHMASVIIGNDGVDAISADTIEEYGTKLSAALKGKGFRMKFTGSETEGSNGNIYTNISIGLPIFAESLKVTETKLKFDVNNTYDFARIETAKDNTVDEFTALDSSAADDVF